MVHVECIVVTAGMHRGKFRVVHAECIVMTAEWCMVHAECIVVTADLEG